MNHRSLLDYLAENFATEEPASLPVQDAASQLERRLAAMERRLASAFGPENPLAADGGGSSFSSQIESIVRGRNQAPAGPTELPQPAQRRRIEIQAPSLAPELPLFSPDGLTEFQKFVEAVHLVGQAANRFMTAPEQRRPHQVQREAPVAVDKDAIRFTLALKDAVSTIQSLAADLRQTAAEMKGAAAGSPLAPPAERTKPTRPAPREDAELEQLRGELEDLRLRMGAYNRRKSGERS